VNGLAGAYDLAGAAWGEGPARLVYDRLAGLVVDRSPVPLAGRVVLDVGAGTGAAGRHLLAAGARPVPVDLSVGMLQANPASAGLAVVADAVRLPVPSGRVDGVVAAFSFNHLADPAAGLREAARVCRAASPVLVAAYAADDHHPVKGAVEQALVEAGWAPEAWYDELRRSRMPQLATLEGMADAARRAGLGGRAERLEVAFSDLQAGDLVTWRLGMAQVARFLARLDPAARRAVRARAVGLLGEDWPPLRRSIVVYVGLT
jgi:ubiquinone/menaquinone biosynthesis C-methylase UbiE